MKLKTNSGRFDGSRGARPAAATAHPSATTGTAVLGETPGSRDWPAVGVVIPTRNRPELLRKALDAVRAQDYPGPLRVLVVFDQAEPDPSLAADGGRPVLVVANARQAGLAGARNTGITALDTELVAFCDDDDVWHPAKLRRQVDALVRTPAAQFSTCAIEVEFEEPRTRGWPGPTW
ncbi:glycosyltransferase family 2 protein [Catellatospora bangladeshensis]|uniref:glycosyltransferase family 2 protein n=1 Tax=Catellatospora bangladeshensis TaxID=310355 RepID=UPI00361A6B3E